MIGKLMSKLVNRNLLYYPGCLTKYGMPEVQEQYEKVMKHAGVDFIKLPDSEFFCCGSPAFNAGYQKDFEDLIEKNIRVFKKYGVGKIVTNCPACYLMLKEYGKIRTDWYIEVEHMSTFLLRLVDNGKLSLSKKYDERVNYHDPCHLGRYSNIYEEPRKLLKIMGFIVVDAPEAREREQCCGGGAGLPTNNSAMANKIARTRGDEAKKLEVKKILTCCPMCYLHLKNNNPDLEVVEFATVMIDALE